MRRDASVEIFVVLTSLKGHEERAAIKQHRRPLHLFDIRKSHAFETLCSSVTISALSRTCQLRYTSVVHVPCTGWLQRGWCHSLLSRSDRLTWERAVKVFFRSAALKGSDPASFLCRSLWIGRLTCTTKSFRRLSMQSRLATRRA